MDLSQSISYNGWTSSLTRSAGGTPMSGYVVDEVRPSVIQTQGYMEKRALEDGLAAADVFLSGRQVAVVVSVYGSTKGDFWDKADDLVAAFSPTLAYSSDSANAGFLAFDFSQPTADVSTWTSGYIPLRYYLRPTAPPAFVVRRDETGGTSGRGMSGRFDIPLVARDPRKYLQSTRSAGITTGTLTAPYRGNYPTLPIITFTLTATGHSAATFTVSGLSVVIDLSGYSSGDFTLDFSDRTLDRSGTNVTGLISSAAGYSPVGAGATYVRANINGQENFPLLTYREAWA